MSYLRDDDTREINHHGVTKPAIADADMEKVHNPPSPDDGHGKIFVKSKRNKTDLISRNEKTQIEAMIYLCFQQNMIYDFISGSSKKISGLCN